MLHEGGSPATFPADGSDKGENYGQQESYASTRSVSRRGSLVTAAGAGLATAPAGAFGAAAKPKPGKLARKKVKAKCQAQVGQCETAFSSVCEIALDPEECQEVVAALLPCCASLSTCNAAAMAQCVAVVFTV